MSHRLANLHKNRTGCFGSTGKARLIPQASVPRHSSLGPRRPPVQLRRPSSTTVELITPFSDSIMCCVEMHKAFYMGLV